VVGFVWFLFLFVCGLLTLVVLLQRGDAGGIGAAFGGGGGDTAFGVKADTTWKKTTSYLAGAFFVLAILLGYLMSGGRTSTIATGGSTPEAPVEGAQAPGGEPSAPAAPASGGAPAAPSSPEAPAPSDG